MPEIELKLLLSDEAAAALRAAPAVAARAQGAPRTRRLRSIYYDTPDHALRAAGIALRLRDVGGAWVQTLKRGREEGSLGLHAPEESEVPAPDGTLDPERFPEPELRAALAEAQAGAREGAQGGAHGAAALAPVFETVMERTAWDLATPLGAAELALDEGEIVAGEARAAFREAELELTDGAPAVLYDLAREIFAEIPGRFSERSKAARGFALAAGEAPLPDRAPRKADPLALDPEAPTEASAARILRACLAQIDANADACLAGDDPEGPHQLRTGLRRLRSAFSLFGEALDGPALEVLKAGARDLGREAGRVRDLDVLIDEILRPAAPDGDPDGAPEGGVDGAADAPGAAAEAVAFAELLAELERRRDAARARLREVLRGPQARVFLLDLSAFVELRGWLRPADHAQTAHLARPTARSAARALKKRRRKARKAARGLAGLSPAERHALRKELKKLRYAVEYFGGLWPERRAKPYLKALKKLQKVFGALNDAAMAERVLTGPEAALAGDPDAQRAIGRLLGRMEAQAEADWRAAQTAWDRFEATPPFWK